MDRSWTSKYDSALKETIKQAKQVPVLINYSISGYKGRFEKIPDKFDLTLIEKIESIDIPYWFPTNRIKKGDKTGEPLRIGITHLHHFFMKRAIWELAALWAQFNIHDGRALRALRLSLTAASPYASKLRRFRAGKKGGGPLAGTLYIASLITPPNTLLTIERNIRFIARGLNSLVNNIDKSITSSQSNESYCSIKPNSLDYIFIDPPFGSNLNYSELNFLWEAWLKVFTNIKPEAIENKTQQKGPTEYRQIMTDCFKESYRILKPGRWITVEFSNTRASVWNNIQTALTEAGFIVANVSALDKQQGSFNAVTNPTSVKQDLIISAYKPNGGFEERFHSEASREEGVWDFIRTHLKYLPITKRQGSQLVAIPERDPRILFDQMVAYYVRKGYPVPLSSQEFQISLSQLFAERDGMIFLPEQVAEYDRKKMTAKELVQASLFVSDEASAIQWLRQLLKSKPQTFSDINPQFMQEISGWKKVEKPLELSTLLKQNFLCYDGKEKVPEQIHAYLSTNWKDMRNLSKDDPILKAKAKDRWYVPDPNKAGDLEKLRERDLLKEFETYKAVKKFKRNDRFRLEAVRAGFKNAWQARDYKTIITIAEKIPPKILEEDPKLLMWYDQAVTRMGDQ